MDNPRRYDREAYIAESYRRRRQTHQSDSVAVADVLGVCDCGKSTLAIELADLLGWTYIEGDDLHPAENIAAMSYGTALTDAMREPWLAAIAAEIGRHRGQGAGVVVSCSALKRSSGIQVARSGCVGDQRSATQLYDQRLPLPIFND